MIVDMLLVPLTQFLEILNQISGVANVTLQSYGAISPILAYGVYIISFPLASAWIASFVAWTTVRLTLGLILWLYRLFPFI